mmetsp:Transcript_22381/g.33068  ORF Transcript_22381/g.33068 Transcript_22381/m.33068 type:complete len:484 (+) Transcript_22381:110-1561(+)
MRKPKNKTVVTNVNNNDHVHQMTAGGSSRNGVVKKYTEHKHRESFSPAPLNNSRRRPHSLPRKQQEIVVQPTHFLQKRARQEINLTSAKSETSKAENKLSKDEVEEVDTTSQQTEDDELKTMLFIKGNERFAPSQSGIMTSLKKSFDDGMKILLTIPALLTWKKRRVSPGTEQKANDESKDSWDSLMKCLPSCQDFGSEMSNTVWGRLIGNDETTSRRISKKNKSKDDDYFQQFYDHTVNVMVKSTNNMMNPRSEKKQRRVRKSPRNSLSVMEQRIQTTPINSSKENRSHENKKKTINFGTSTVKFYDPETEPSHIRMTDTIPIPQSGKLSVHEKEVGVGKKISMGGISTKSSNQTKKSVDKTGKTPFSKKVVGSIEKSPSLARPQPQDVNPTSTNKTSQKHTQKTAMKKRDRPSISTMTAVERRKYFGIKTMNALKLQEKDDLVKMMQACYREDLMMPGYQPTNNVQKASMIHWMRHNVFEF